MPSLSCFNLCVSSTVGLFGCVGFHVVITSLMCLGELEPAGILKPGLSRAKIVRIIREDGLERVLCQTENYRVLMTQVKHAPSLNRTRAEQRHQM